jgi:hypothetical protein
MVCLVIVRMRFDDQAAERPWSRRPESKLP